MTTTKRYGAAAILSIVFALLSVLAGNTASASTTNVQAQRDKAMHKANVVCDGVTEEVQYENCVIGEYVLTTGHAISANGYEYVSNGEIVVLHNVRNAVRKYDARKAQDAAMRKANVVCDSVAEDVQYENCVIGEYVLTTGRVLRPRDYKVSDSGVVTLVRTGVATMRKIDKTTCNMHDAGPSLFACVKTAWRKAYGQTLRDNEFTWNDDASAVLLTRIWFRRHDGI